MLSPRHAVPSSPPFSSQNNKKKAFKRGREEEDAGLRKHKDDFQAMYKEVVALGAALLLLPSACVHVC